jgi:hypothetical protein
MAGCYKIKDKHLSFMGSTSAKKTNIEISEFSYRIFVYSMGVLYI